MTINAASFRELKLDRLSRDFGSHNALKDVSLTIGGAPVWAFGALPER